MNPCAGPVNRNARYGVTKSRAYGGRGGFRLTVARPVDEEETPPRNRSLRTEFVDRPHTPPSPGPSSARPGHDPLSASSERGLPFRTDGDRGVYKDGPLADQLHTRRLVVTVYSTRKPSPTAPFSSHESRAMLFNEKLVLLLVCTAAVMVSGQVPGFGGCPDFDSQPDFDMNRVRAPTITNPFSFSFFLYIFSFDFIRFFRVTRFQIEFSRDALFRTN